jgi:tripartite-type tricarboxylate transporter receptor subunit TctC
MKLHRRDFLHLTAGAAALPATSRFVMAQAYPTRPIRLIAPFPAGGSIDLTARLIGQWLTDRLGQQVVIENRSGAAGNIGSEAALSSPPDGYTLLLCSVANAISATLYDKLNYNFRDVAPVAGISRAPNVMVLHPSVPANTVPEFIAYAKGNPGKINMASSGTGTSIHMSGELFKLMTGINMQHVPYRGSAHRPPCRPSPGRLRQLAAIHTAHQGWHAARAGSDDGDALGGAARSPNGWRFCDGLRGKHMERHVRAQEHAG